MTIGTEVATTDIEITADGTVRPVAGDPDRFDAWLHRLLVRACADHVRRTRLRPLEVTIGTIDRPDPHDDVGRIVDRDEIERAFGIMLATFHPALHEGLVGVLAPEERDDPVPALWRRILDPDPAVHARAARAWFHAERALSEIVPPNARGHDAPTLVTPRGVRAARAEATA